MQGGGVLCSRSSHSLLARGGGPMCRCPLLAGKHVPKCNRRPGGIIWAGHSRRSSTARALRKLTSQAHLSNASLKPLQLRELHAIHPCKEATAMLSAGHAELQLEELLVEKIAHVAIDLASLKRRGVLRHAQPLQAFEHMRYLHLPQSPPSSASLGLLASCCRCARAITRVHRPRLECVLAS